MKHSKRIWMGSMALALSLSCLAGCQSGFSGLAKEDGMSPRQIADVKVAMARTLEQQGQEDKATVVYEEAIKLDPKRSDATLRLGILYDKAGKFRESEDCYKKALKAQPGNPDIFCNMGYSLYLQRRWPEAEMNLKQALALDSNHARAHNNLGLVLAHSGDADNALAEFVRAGCGQHQAHLNLAFVLTVEGQWQEARQHYQVAVGNPTTAPQAQKGLRMIESLAQSAANPAASNPTAQLQFGSAQVVRASDDQR